jgi:hypothetical protein
MVDLTTQQIWQADDAMQLLSIRYKNALPESGNMLRIDPIYIQAAIDMPKLTITYRRRRRAY